ncbi:MAG: hypothetical protein HY823_10165 [Acidobacteria bacterium]|nr:hypothetical protein [Acidobacteriota bacterium]
MCGGLEFHRKKPVEGGLGLLPEDYEVVRVLFPNPRAALLVDPGTGTWLPWGRRKGEPGDWPEGGWARFESLSKPYWTRWEPEPLLVHPVRWMEKDPQRRSHWFDLVKGEGIHVLRLHRAPGSPVYVVTVPSSGGFEEIHDRMPRVVERL